ncbi:MAG TPA: peptidylprolyl isomerase [Thermoanaerobaculia bacterium]|nr:peptidylprolyl isomerase [Thermoanaerobaculia bacterium]
MSHRSPQLAAALVAALLTAEPALAQAPKPAEAPPAAAAPQTTAPPQPSVAPAPAEPAPLAPEKLPAVVAKVNGHEIKKDELLAQLRGVQPDITGGLNPALAHRVLDTLIARALLRQEAQAQGVTVTDEEVKKEVEELRGQFPTPEAFAQALAAEGMNEVQLLDRARQEFLVQKYVETKVAPKVAVTDEAAKAFYDQNQERMKTPEQLHLRHILVSVEPTATPEDKQKAKTEADAVLAKVKAGGDFAALAKEHSDDPGSKEKGGDLGWIAKGQTVEPFEQAALALKDQEVSGVVETRFGHHVIQRLETRPAGLLPFPEVKERIVQFLKQRDTQQALQAEVQVLRTKGKVETFI